MKKVLFINPPRSQPKESLKRCIVPMGLAYMASYLEKEKHDVRILDCVVEGYDKEIPENDSITFGLTEKDVKDYISDFEPDFVGVSFLMTSEAENSYNVCKWVKETNRDIKVMIGGAHASAYAQHFIKDENIDFVVFGEGEESTQRIVNGEAKGIVHSPLVDLDNLPWPARHLLPMEKYLKIDMPTSVFGVGKRITQIETSRGCPFNCLSGDTLVNTVEGNIPIRDLVGRKKIGVYTYNSLTKRAFIIDAINVRKIGVNKKVVKINFSDKSSIKCTPNHRFLTFKNSNQYVGYREFEIEAKDLKKGNSVKALKFYKNKRCSYIEVCCGRSCQKRSRMVVEYLIGRKLELYEHAHHKDRNSLNDSLDNLLFCANAKEHSSYHPEKSERMKNDNPVKYCTKESIEKTRKKITGLKRSKEAKRRYSLSKLGEKNPMWKDIDEKKVARLYKEGYSMYTIGHILDCGRSCIRRSLRNQGVETRSGHQRGKQINHVVESVEYLDDREDVYDLEVPETHWFFANNVLVHNCCFCCTTHFWERQWRPRSPKNVVSEMKYLIDEYGIDEFDVLDSNLVISKKRMFELCELMKPLNIYWANPGGVWAGGLTKPLLKEMKESGCYQVTFAVESANPQVLKDIIHKPTKIDPIRGLVDYCHEIGIDTHAFFVLGFPEESLESMHNTYDWAKKTNFTSVTFNIIQPLPGSEIWNQHFKGKITNFKDINMRKANITHPEISKEDLEKMVDDFNYKFNRSVLWRHPKMFFKKYVRVALKRKDLRFVKKMFRRQ